MENNDSESCVQNFLRSSCEYDHSHKTWSHKLSLFQGHCHFINQTCTSTTTIECRSLNIVKQSIVLRFILLIRAFVIESSILQVFWCAISSARVFRTDRDAPPPPFCKLYQDFIIIFHLSHTPGLCSDKCHNQKFITETNRKSKGKGSVLFYFSVP